MAEKQVHTISDEALRKLEFDAVLEMLANHCQFQPGSVLAKTLRPSSSRVRVERMLAETAEGVEVVARYPEISAAGATDLTSMLDSAAKGSRLSAEDLGRVAATLHVSSTTSKGIRRAAAAGEVSLPHFLRMASSLVELPFLEQLIDRSIGPAGEVLDSASEDLARFRREIRSTHGRLMDRLNRMISGDRFAGVLQDNLITTRDGRYVLPVRADARSKLPGVVHDVSASGQTLFMEPMEIVDLNNRWREALAAEQHEIDRILLHLSNAVGAESEFIQQAIDTLAEIDLVLAKAKLSFSIRAHQPRIWPTEKTTKSSTPLRLHLKRARHPLMDQREVVPIDVDVGGAFRALLITGPNTGGKTVALKTIGLLATMAQSGLFITADDESMTSVFDGVFVDVGDDQSIAQSLSTFSGHMTNVIRILESASFESLVLIDEIGSGTDPQEGSALARAVVSEILNRGSLLVATTHYSEVKTFAHETAGVENASVEFDLETLAPTYRLLTGVPGQSNALAIAQRLGLSDHILEQAQSYLNLEDVQTDRLLQDIQEKRRLAEEEREKIETDRKEIERLRRRAEEALIEAELKRKSAYDEALLEAEMLMAETRRLAKASEKQLRSGQRSSDQERMTAPLRDSAAESVTAVKKLARAKGVERRVERLQVGDRVRIRSLDQEGQVVRAGIEDADVQMGSLRLTRPLIDLTRLQPVEAPPSSRPKYQTRSVDTPMEIDIRGRRYEEVVDILDGYLNEAAFTSLPFVRIIHGKGTGALRKAVTDYLRSSPVVEKFQHGKPEEGGDGVTVVFLAGS